MSTTIDITSSTGETLVTDSAALAAAARWLRPTGPTFTFTVYGLEFCRLLEAVALFQARPKDSDQYSAVRGFVRYDGLTLAAVNLFSSAVGTISVVERDGAGIFSLPHAQAGLVLKMFKKRLPKDTSEEEYVLEVEVERHRIRIREVSGLFDNDELLIAVPDDGDLERGESSGDEIAMRTAAAVHGVLREARPFQLDGGRTVMPGELALMCKAARVLGAPLYLRTHGTRLLGIVIDGHGRELIASLGVGATDGADLPDTVLLAEYRERLDELVESGAL